MQHNNVSRAALRYLNMLAAVLNNTDAIDFWTRTMHKKNLAVSLTGSIRLQHPNVEQLPKFTDARRSMNAVPQGVNKTFLLISLDLPW